MRKRFRSKIGLIVILAILISVGFPLATMPFSWKLAIPLSILSLIILPLLFGTYYQIDGETLIVRSGIFKWKIDIFTIVSIRRTNSALSAPALSMDRLEILYHSGTRRIVISPTDKKEFVKTLTNINQNILTTIID